MAASRLLTGVSLAFLASASAPALAVTDDDLLKDDQTTGDVLTYGLGYKAQRYSPLDGINKDTVKRLVPAWTLSFGGEKQRGQESQPIVADGTLYVTASYSRVYAVDAKTGQEKWQYDARLPDGILPCCDVVNRGAAIYKDKIYFTTLDAQLVALNKETGKAVWRKKMEKYSDGYSNTAAPLVVKGKVIVGNSGRRVRHRRGGQGLRCRDRRGGLVPSHDRRAHGPAERPGVDHDRDDQRLLARRPVEERRRSHLARRHLRSGARPVVLRHRPAGALEQLAAPRRQSLQLLDPGHRSR